MCGSTRERERRAAAISLGTISEKKEEENGRNIFKGTPARKLISAK